MQSWTLVDSCGGDDDDDDDSMERMARAKQKHNNNNSNRTEPNRIEPSQIYYILSILFSLFNRPHSSETYLFMLEPLHLRSSIILFSSSFRLAAGSRARSQLLVH